MPSVLTQPRMTQAPQQGAQVDWGNPLAAGLAALFNPAAPANAATGAAVSVFGGSLARAVDPVIGLVQATAVNGSNWNTPGAYKGTGADITLWAQLVPNALGGTSRIFLGTSNSSNAGVSIGYSSGTSQFVFTKGAVADISSGFAPTAGQPYFLAASYRHATGLVTFYVRNLLTGAVFTGTATNTSSFVAGDGTFEYGGRQNATNNTLVGSMGMAGIAMRALPLTELAAIADNPAQLFKAPPRRLWLAAGSVTNTPVNPDSGSISLTGYAPTVTQPIAVAPGAGSLTLTGYAPAIAQPIAVQPGAGGITITGYAPTIAQPQAVNPGAGSLSFTGYAPSVTQSINTGVNPGAGTLVLSGYAPVVAQTANVSVGPGAGALSLAGYAPLVSQGTSQSVAPSPGTLALSGYAPAVAQAPMASDARYARPIADIAAGAWAPSSGSSLSAMLSEQSTDETTYISTSVASACEVKLNPVIDPATSSGQVVRYQVWSAFGNGITVRLKQGAAVIAVRAHASLPTSPTVYSMVLSPAECDSITDYGDLRIEFAAA